MNAQGSADFEHMVWLAIEQGALRPIAVVVGLTVVALILFRWKARRDLER